jgi:hypothetical protein
MREVLLRDVHEVDFDAPKTEKGHTGRILSHQRPGLFKLDRERNRQ